MEKCVCGSQLCFVRSAEVWFCKECGTSGPSLDGDGKRWNSLMRSARERDELRAKDATWQEVHTSNIQELRRLREQVERLTRGGCGKPGHTTASSDDGTCYCLTCQLESEVERLTAELAELRAGWDRRAFQPDQSVDTIRNCGTCRWAVRNQPREGNADTFDCRRYPSNEGFWFREDFFCGEWQPKGAK